MENDGGTNQFSRRGFLGIGSAVFAAAGSLAVSSAVAQENQQRTDRSATDPGPANAALDAQNPDSAWPPATDSKSLVQNFKYPFSLANKRTYEGGWSREVTARELAVSKDLAGVNMRLAAGGVRELHWHTANEWAIVLYGSARITAIDRDGKSFVADTKKDDLWYFPSGIPHSIQGLDPDGTEFMLVFDDGNFSESETVLLSDSMAHLPPEVLSKNFGVAEAAIKNVPKKRAIHFPDCGSRITGGRPENCRWNTWKVVPGFRFSHNGDAADEAHQRRRGAHRGFERLPGLNQYCDGNGHGSPGGAARTALASQC